MGTRYVRGMKSHAFNGIRQKKLLETTAEDFFTVLEHKQMPLHSGSQVSSLRRIEWCDQGGIEFPAKRATNSTPLSSQTGWHQAEIILFNSSFQLS